MIEHGGQCENGTNAGALAVRLRVVGCGNPYAADDSAGLEIVRRLRNRGEGACEFLAVPQAGLELLGVMPGADVVLFVDAMASGAPPGTLHLGPLPSPDMEPRALSSLSSHGWGLAEMLRLMLVLRWRRPRLMLLGVEVGTLAPGAPRSAAVEGAIRTVVERFSHLRTFLTAPQKSEWHTPRRFLPGDTSFPGGS